MFRTRPAYARGRHAARTYPARPSLWDRHAETGLAAAMLAPVAFLPVWAAVHAVADMLAR